MDTSIFSKATSSGYGSLGTPSHDLPRWRSPSPMARSIVPPPILASTYDSIPRTVERPVIIDRPSPLQDRQSQLEGDLQFLLDAQAEGLVRGLEGGLTDDQTSTGSTTPTVRSMRSVSTRRASRPARRKPGLRSARKGIYNAILSLSEVKGEELQSVDEDIREKEQALEQINEWEKKRQGLQEATKGIHSNEDTVRVQRLRQEADNVQEEINHVELQLGEMRSRHKKLLRQATAVENSVQAKLASYTSSLRLLEDEVQRSLSVQPTKSNTRPASRKEPATKQRTLDVARQQQKSEQQAVLEQRRSVEYEKTALDEGAAVWKDVVAQLTDFERRMRAEMSKQSSASADAGLAWDDTPKNDASQRLRDLLEHMKQLADMLTAKFELSKSRNWNLLIAAIGAEVDALEQGRQLLEGVLRSDGQDSGDSDGTLQGVVGDPAGGSEIHELDKSFETARRRMSNGTAESEDDPDPELLFSRQDIDAV